MAGAMRKLSSVAADSPLLCESRRLAFCWLSSMLRSFSSCKATVAVRAPAGSANVDLLLEIVKVLQPLAIPGDIGAKPVAL